MLGLDCRDATGVLEGVREGLVLLLLKGLVAHNVLLATHVLFTFRSSLA